MFIAVEIIRARIVGHVKIGPAIIVIITPFDAEAIVPVGIIDSGLL